MGQRKKDDTRHDGEWRARLMTRLLYSREPKNVRAHARTALTRSQLSDATAPCRVRCGSTGTSATAMCSRQAEFKKRKRATQEPSVGYEPLGGYFFSCNNSNR
ncbi:unnamed protein product [Arctia plantaginis]|uniref:Uncharacterized protein n=1 Tax=Arctia plantaginis TaxID=874455 RepID=A0A8S1BJP7_ARCPL|nr:unnamed protein product [Arctia plantaginis]